MIGSRVAVQTKCLALPLRQALHTASRLGGDGVQIDLRQVVRSQPRLDLVTVTLSEKVMRGVDGTAPYTDEIGIFGLAQRVSDQEIITHR